MCATNKQMVTITMHAPLLLQVYTQLNHLNIAIIISYNALHRIVDEISKNHLSPLVKWLQEGAYVKFIGDNVDGRKTVRDIRSDHHDILHHMYSMLAVKARAIPPPPSTPFVRPKLISHNYLHVLSFQTVQICSN